MGIKINEIRFNNDFRVAQDLSYLHGVIGEKFKVEVDFIFEDITFVTTSKSIILHPDNNAVGLASTDDIIQIDKGFGFSNYEVDDIVTVFNFTGSTFTDYTIIEKINGSIIRVNATFANTVLVDGSYIFNKTPFSAVRYAYNLIDVGTSFDSLIDGEFQEAEIGDADAAILTDKLMAFTGELSYQIGSIKVKGRGRLGLNGGAGDVQQLFTITHDCVLTPFFLLDQYNDLLIAKKPLYFEGNERLNYIANLSLGRGLNNPNGLQELSVTTDKSVTFWFNENKKYVLSSLILTDVAGAVVVSQLQFDKEIRVEVIIDNTADTPFVDGLTKYTFGFNYLPDDVDDIEKNGFDQTRNFAFDSKTNTLGSGSLNGDNFGNDLQIIKTVTSTFISDSQMKVTVIIQTRADSNAIIQQGDNDRYQLWLITENHALDANKSDKVNVLVQVNDFFVQKTATNPIISSFGTKFIQHPYIDKLDGVLPSALNIFPVDDLVANLDFSINYDPNTGPLGVFPTLPDLGLPEISSGAAHLLFDVTQNKVIAIADWQGTFQSTMNKLRDSLNDNVSHGTIFGGYPAYTNNGGYSNATVVFSGGRYWVNFLAPTAGTTFNGQHLQIVSDLLSKSNSFMAGGVDAISTFPSKGVIIKKIQSKILLKNLDIPDADILLEEFSFSTANFPLVGDVQDILFEQDRVFKIKSGDIRKVISCKRIYSKDSVFEKHFTYSYPFMFRWEYWQKLILSFGQTIQPALFDNASQHNGINHFWHRYTTIGVWHIFYDVIFTMEQNGVEFTQTFSSQLQDSRDFDGNTDWSNSTIKSYDLTTAAEITNIGIKYIYGFENVEIKLDTLKTTGVLPPIANVGMVAWIETFESGGIPDIRRFSSYYDKGADTWFSSADSSDKIVMTKVGNKYTGTLEVDHTKLPSNTEFTIYARLYEYYDSDIKQFMNSDPFHFMNSDPYQFMASVSGASPLILGNAWKQKFEIIASNPTPSTILPALSQDTLNDCCFSIPALAQVAGGDDLKNDKHSPYFVWSKAFSAATMYLEKFVNGAWVISAVLNDNTYGLFHLFGFYVTKFQENAIGYELEWSKVLDLKGSGKYRIRCSATPFTGGDDIDKFSFEFCLDVYSDARANRTTRWSWNISGTIGDQYDDEHKIDYGLLNWFNQIRLPESFFGNDKTSEHEKNFVKYQSGVMKWIEDSQVESYTFTSGRYPDELHRFIKINILQADEISVTDFNTRNANNHVNKKVTWTGTYEPDYPAGVLKVVVNTEFQQATQNFNHKRC
ncbi:MAG: hypothetical protein ACUZ8H_16100 [Candidatus Anammoxibacter sp.]